jgi:hypothetical protein
MNVFQRDKLLNVTATLRDQFHNVCMSRKFHACLDEYVHV